MGELGKSPQPLQFIGHRYRVECCIASSVEASVVGAIDCATGKRVALKCWDGPTSEQEVAAAQCFVRSANVAGLFDNPHVVEVYRTELGDTTSYSVTEWLEGSTLAREVARLGRLPVREALQLVLPCMRAVVEAHAAGVIHGDIRPAHIFLCRARRHLPERARVFDFGRGSAGFHELRMPTRAVVDEFCRYTPPELLCGAALDARSDVYAFGLLLYEVITGERIFLSDDLFDLLREIEKGPQRAVADVTQTLPRGLTEVLYRAMAVRPEERYQELATFLDALLPFGAKSASAPDTYAVSHADRVTNLATDQSPLPRMSRRTLGAWSGAALVATMLGLGALAFDDGIRDSSQSDNSNRPVTSHNAAVHAEPASPGPQPEPAHDLIIAEPFQVAEPERSTDQHTQVSPRRSRVRSARQRERAAQESSVLEPHAEASRSEPALPALNGTATPQAESATPLERMQLQ